MFALGIAATIKAVRLRQPLLVPTVQKPATRKSNATVRRYRLCRIVSLLLSRAVFRQTKLRMKRTAGASVRRRCQSRSLNFSRYRR